MVSHLAVEHSLTRRAGQGNFKVRKKITVPPNGPRPKALAVLAEFRDERVLHTECGGQMSHERVEEPLPSLGLDALDDGAEGDVFRKRRLFVHLVPLV